MYVIEYNYFRVNRQTVSSLMYSTKQILPINLYGIAQIANSNESNVELF